ncbi:MAG TPA: hypothetical protein VGI43_05210 [Mucilaginibacter sp.]|jgi:hypothetical protein
MKMLFISLLVLVSARTLEQKNEVHNYSVIKASEWIIPRNDTLDYAFGEYLGQKALLMKRKIENYKSASIAYPKNLKFMDGIIELDAAWPGDKNGFVGLAFRIKDAHHYETVYFRPESSGTINAMQYMPEKRFDFNWWDYESDKYQAKTTLPLHGWFHIKLIVKGNNLSVFVNHLSKAIFNYSALDNSLKTGSVGLWLGNSSIGAFKNLVVTNL